MKLTRLHLKNFLSHRETEVKFPKTGITLISGENGMGKSSLFDALQFALFGNSFQKAKSLVTRGKKSIGVEAEFTHRDHEYRVIREYVATEKDFRSTKTEMWKDGALASVGKTKDLNFFIVKELGINHEMFKYSVMAVQGEIMGVLGISASDRRAVFERMFRYHQLRLVAEAAKSLASDEEKVISLTLKTTGHATPEELERDIEARKKAMGEKEALLSGVLSEKKGLMADEDKLAREGRELDAEERELNELEKERTALEREILVIGKEIDRLEGQQKENKEKIKEIPSLMESLRSLEGALSELSAMRAEADILATLEKESVKLSEISKRLEETREYEKTLKKLLPYHEKFTYLRQEEEAVRAEIESLKVRLGATEELQKNLLRKQKEKEDLEQKIAALPEIKESREKILARIDEIESEAMKTESDNGALKGQIKNLERTIAEIEGLGETCPLCKQRLTPEHKADVLKQLRQELAEVKKQAELFSERSNAITKEAAALKKLAKDTEEKEHLEKLLSGCMAEISEARKRLEENAGISEKHEALGKSLEDLRAEIKNLEQAEKEFTAAGDFVARNPPEPLEFAMAEAQQEIEVLAGNRRFPKIGAGEIRDRIKELSPAEREYGKLDAEIKNLEKLALEVEKQELLLAEKRAGLAEKKTRFESLAGTEARRASLEERKKSHREAMERLQAKKESLNAKEINLRRDIQVIENELNGLNSSLETTRKKLGNLAILSKISKKLLSPEGIEREFLNTLLRLEDNLNAYFQEFSFSDLQRVRLDENMVPVKVDEIGEQMERLSGGEQVAMGIAMRFAIARALLDTESESLFLDEPTHNLDSDRILSLQDILVQFKLHQTAPQVVIITHDDDMKVIADTVIEVVKEGGVSKIANR